MIKEKYIIFDRILFDKFSKLGVKFYYIFAKIIQNEATAGINMKNKLILTTAISAAIAFGSVIIHLASLQII